MLWVLDLDGVVWLSGRPIPGAREAIDGLQRAGHQVVFLTNNSGPTLDEYAARLQKAGIRSRPDQLATSAQAAAQLLKPGNKVLVVGDDGLREAVRQKGAEVVGTDDGQPDAVVVGRTVDLDYQHMSAAATAVRAGARFIATNSDPTFPTPEGLLPGAGALVSFVSTASGRQPEIAGKPHSPVVDLVKQRYGQPDVMVGDRADTDGAFARAAGARFALVLSGSTSRDQLPVEPSPDLVADDLRSAVEQLVGDNFR